MTGNSSTKTKITFQVRPHEDSDIQTFSDFFRERVILSDDYNQFIEVTDFGSLMVLEIFPKNKAQTRRIIDRFLLEKEVFGLDEDEELDPGVDLRDVEVYITGDLDALSYITAKNTRQLTERVAALEDYTIEQLEGMFNIVKGNKDAIEYINAMNDRLRVYRWQEAMLVLLEELEGRETGSECRDQLIEVLQQETH